MIQQERDNFTEDQCALFPLGTEIAIIVELLMNIILNPKTLFPQN